MKPLSIGKKSKKLGKIRTFSFPQGCGCPVHFAAVYGEKFALPCMQDCYMNKAIYKKVYTHMIVAHRNNWNLYHSDPDYFWDNLVGGISRIRKERYFRWFQNGDIADFDFLCKMVEVAEMFPEMHFMVMTKRYDLVREYLDKIGSPKPLMVRMSTWPGWTPPVAVPELPVSIMQDGTVKTKAFICTEDCPTCHFCWHSKKAVQFHKH